MRRRVWRRQDDEAAVVPTPGEITEALWDLATTVEGSRLVADDAVRLSCRRALLLLGRPFA